MIDDRKEYRIVADNMKVIDYHIKHDKQSKVFKKRTWQFKYNGLVYAAAILKHKN